MIRASGDFIPLDSKAENYSFQSLGNTRVVFNDQGEILQMHDYYPFGLEFTGRQGGEIKYRYNGKELQDDVIGGLGLEWYDYGFRFYDPQLGRFHTIDPLAENGYQWSPYNYGFDNPINMIDPDGQWPWPDELTNFANSITNAVQNTVDAIANATYAIGDAISEGYNTLAGINLEGIGDHQAGGHPVTTESGGASPTKTTADHVGHEIEADDILSVNPGAGQFSKSVLDFANAIDKMSMVISESKNIGKPGENNTAKSNSNSSENSNSVPSSNSASRPGSQVVVQWGPPDSAGTYYGKDSSVNGNVTYYKTAVGSASRTPATKQEFEERWKNW